MCDSVLSPVQSSATCEDCTVAWGVCNHGMHAMHAYVSLRASHPAPESFPRRSLADALRRLYNAFTDASMWAMCMLYVLSPSCAAFHFHCISRWLKTRQVCPLGTIYIGHCTHTSHAIPSINHHVDCRPNTPPTRSYIYMCVYDARWDMQQQTTASGSSRSMVVNGLDDSERLWT